MTKLLIIIVVYNDSPNDTNAFITLSKSFDYYCFNILNKNQISFFIYDNSFEKHSISTRWDHTYIHDNSNPGVSYAYNEGFNFAKNNDYNWVLLSDQDTLYPLEYFCNIFNHLKDIKSCIFAPILKDENLILSPVRFKYFKGFPINNLQTTGTIEFKKRIWPLNSGLIISNDIFENFSFDNNAKLDFSDFIFINKITKRINSYYLMNIVLIHSLSSNLKQPLYNKLVRFNYYIKGLKQYSLQINTVYFGFLFLFLRATYLNFKNTTIKFYYNLNEYFK